MRERELCWGQRAARLSNSAGCSSASVGECRVTRVTNASLHSENANTDLVITRYHGEESTSPSCRKSIAFQTRETRQTAQSQSEIPILDDEGLSRAMTSLHFVSNNTVTPARCGLRNINRAVPLTYQERDSLHATPVGRSRVRLLGPFSHILSQRFSDLTAARGVARGRWRLRLEPLRRRREKDGTDHGCGKRGDARETEREHRM